SVNQSTRDQFLKHLSRCDFTPPLNTYVNVSEYVKKIAKHAKIFEAWNENKELIGVIAIYIDTTGKRLAFITNISCVREYQRRGIMTVLLQKCIKNIYKMGIKEIMLEVYACNKKALNFYKKHNFREVKNINDRVTMKIEITGEMTR
ncbi:MAG: GNAT family N-acetyltransferase, partial [Elusimicrobia bacterium]|nr:GNAT family N-acetyltransferase [Elusimicrobiota bacterium]